MRWIHSGISGISDWLGINDSPVSSEAKGRFEKVREAMVASLGEAGAARNLRLVMQLRVAPDAQALWYRRSELMGALSSMHGERQAGEIMHALTVQFEGLVPSAVWRSSERSASLQQARA